MAPGKHMAMLLEVVLVQVFCVLAEILTATIDGRAEPSFYDPYGARTQIHDAEPSHNPDPYNTGYNSYTATVYLSDFLFV